MEQAFFSTPFRRSLAGNLNRYHSMQWGFAIQNPIFQFGDTQFFVFHDAPQSLDGYIKSLKPKFAQMGCFAKRGCCNKEAIRSGFILKLPYGWLQECSL